MTVQRTSLLLCLCLAAPALVAAYHARASLLEVIARILEKEAKERQTGLEKVQDLLKRVDWLRAVKLTAVSGLALALGASPVGLIGEAFRLGDSGAAR